MKQLISRVFILALVGGLLMGCAQEPPASVASVRLPDHFTQTGTAPTVAQFWQAFSDPQLDQLVQQAHRRKRPDLVAACPR